jgi:ketosteroid isomerase-like protein
MDDVADIKALEERRRAALATGDIDALGELFSDDYVHVHATSVVHDKPAMLAHVRKSPRAVEPRSPKIRVYGDVAVLTGETVNILPAAGGAAAGKTKLYTTQVARKIGGDWKFVSFQATRIPE